MPPSETFPFSGLRKERCRTSIFTHFKLGQGGISRSFIAAGVEGERRPPKRLPRGNVSKRTVHAETAHFPRFRNPADSRASPSRIRAPCLPAELRPSTGTRTIRSAQGSIGIGPFPLPFPGDRRHRSALEKEGVSRANCTTAAVFCSLVNLR